MQGVGSLWWTCRGFKNNKTAWETGFDTTDKNTLQLPGSEKRRDVGRGTCQQGVLRVAHLQVSVEFYCSNVGHLWEILYHEGFA